MTSLAQQLQRLALPQASATVLAKERRNKSLLFDPKEAGNIDKDTFYAIGVNGLQELQSIDPSFQEFQQTLFDEASKSLERSTQTKDVNEMLDKKIRSFLLRLSPYFTLKPAQKALEWLVYRFYIYQYNIDDLMMCILPYHETKIFVRVIQLLNLTDKSNKWSWMEPIQEPGVPLSRNTVLTHCSKDTGFAQFVCKLVPAMIKAHYDNNPLGSTQRSKQSLRVTFSFYASTIIGAMENASTIEESFLAILIPYLMKGLKSKMEEYKASSYMIISHLCGRSVLTSELLNPLVERICKNFNPSLEMEAVSCLAVICQTQKLTEFPMRSFRNLCQFPQLVFTLQGLFQEHDITPLFNCISQQLMITCLQLEELGGNEDKEEPDFYQLLWDILSEINLNVKQADAITRFLLKNFIKQERNVMISPSEKLADIIKLLERKYPESMDSAIQSYSDEAKDLTQQNCLQKFTQLTISGSRHIVIQESQVSLVLSLNHSNVAVRLAAVRHLHKLAKEGKTTKEFLSNALLQRICDEDKKVLLAVLQMSQFLLSELSAVQVIDNLERIIRKWRRKENHLWMEVAEQVVKLLTSKVLWLTDKDACDRCLSIILPYLFPTTTKKSDMEGAVFKWIASSDLAKMHSVLVNLSSVKQKSDVKETMAAILDCLSNNLIKMKEEERTHQIQILIQFKDSHHQQQAYRLILSMLLGKVMSGMTNPDQILQIAEKKFLLLKEDLEKMVSKDTTFKKPDAEVTGDNYSADVYLAHLAQLLVVKEKSPDSASMSYGLAQGTLWSTMKLVSDMQPPEDISEQVWLKLPATPCSSQERYLLLLLQLTDVTIQGVASGRLPEGIVTFKKVLEDLLVKHLSSLSSLCKFFSLIWTSHLCSAADRPLKASATLLAFSLHVVSMRLTTAAPEEVKVTLSKNDYEFVSLVMLLSHPLQPIRQKAVECLGFIREYIADTSSAFGWMLKCILKRTAEIVADGNYIPQVFKDMFYRVGRESSDSVTKEEKRKKGEECLLWLITCITDPALPNHFQPALLSMLFLVDNQQLLSSLLHTFSNLLDSVSANQKASFYHMTTMAQILHHYTPTTADMVEDDLSEELLLRALSLDNIYCPGMTSLQKHALDGITPAFFQALPSFDIQQKFIGKLIDLHISSKNPEVSGNVSKVLRMLPLNAKHVICELHQEELGAEVKNLQQARKARRSKQMKSEHGADQISEAAWQRVTFVLEHLQQRKIHRMKNATEIVPVLFTLLSRCQEAHSYDGNIEYVKQLILTIIHKVCKAATMEDEPTIQVNEQQFNVELVVQCIRTSDNPQTHNHAMLLLTLAAQLFPEHLLHNVMSIFTFMGANMLHHDDSHSFQVINRTLQTVIPALLNASTQGKLPTSLASGLDNIVHMIIRVFVDAFPHIPDHRKLPLFTQLISTVGDERYLWSCLVLLIESFVIKGVAALYPEEEITDTKSPGRSEDFWLALCHQFSPCVQVISLRELIKYLAALPEDKTDEGYVFKCTSPTKRLTRSQTLPHGNSLFDLSRHSAKHLRHFKFTALGFISHLLANEGFVTQVADQSGTEQDHLKGLYQGLLEESLTYIHNIAHSVEDNANNNTAKFWRALLHRAYDILDKVNALLPAQVFIQVISGLLGNQLVTVRRKAMDLLNNKLAQYKEQFTKEETSLLLSMVTELIAVVKAPTSKAALPEVDLNRQTALYSLKLLCKILGYDHPKEFAVVVELSLDVLKEEDNVQLSSSALLCLAETVSSLQAHAIPYLTRFMPLLLVAMKEREGAQNATDQLYLLCAVTAVQKTIETLPNFLSPYITQLMQRISVLSSKSVDEKSQLSMRLKACQHVLAKQVPTRVILPSVAKCFAELQGENGASLGTLMHILSKHISYLPKEDLVSYHSAATNFFLTALDYRATHQEASLDDILTIETYVIQCMLAHIMKLSENTFRPMFLKMFDWATNGNASNDRLLAFYHLCDAIADKLKSLFCLFVGHIVSNCAEVLNANNSSKSDTPFFEGSFSSEKSSLLLKFLMDCLTKCFMHDKGEFVSKERFELLTQPLVDQLENMIGGNDEYRTRVANHLSPCITQLMASVGDPGAWQPLNYQLLLKMRHDSAKVRYAALSVLEEIHQNLKENYLSLLPETIPFLAELMEDEHEEVEEKCQEVVKELEKTLGEPLQKHF